MLSVAVMEKVQCWDS